MRAQEYDKGKREWLFLHGVKSFLLALGFERPVVTGVALRLFLKVGSISTGAYVTEKGRGHLLWIFLSSCPKGKLHTVSLLSKLHPHSSLATVRCAWLSCSFWLSLLLLPSSGSIPLPPSLHTLMASLYCTSTPLLVSTFSIFINATHTFTYTVLTVCISLTLYISLVSFALTFFYFHSRNNKIMNTKLTELCSTSL